MLINCFKTWIHEADPTSTAYSKTENRCWRSFALSPGVSSSLETTDISVASLFNPKATIDPASSVQFVVERYGGRLIV